MSHSLNVSGSQRMRRMTTAARSCGARRHFFTNDATILGSRRQRIYRPGHLSRRACFGVVRSGRRDLRNRERVSLVCDRLSRSGDFCGIEFFLIDNATDRRRKRDICRGSLRLRSAASATAATNLLWRALLLVRGCPPRLRLIPQSLLRLRRFLLPDLRTLF